MIIQVYLRCSMENKKTLKLSFFMPVSIVLLYWLTAGFVPFGNKTQMTVDFGKQIIDFIIYFRNSILSGNFEGLIYSFSNGIGGDMHSTWTYYIMSPLNLIYVLLPLKFINYATALIILLRYGLMGLSFAYFILHSKKFPKDNMLYIIIFATIYSLSGYNISYQMLPMYFDSIILLPLLVLYLERFIDKSSSKLIDKKYIFLLAFTIFLNYYIGFMICVFLAIYFVFYILTYHDISQENLRTIFRKFILFMMNSILAVFMDALVLIPTISQLLKSKGEELNYSFKFDLTHSPILVLARFIMDSYKSWADSIFGPNIYIASIGFLGLVVYLLSDRKVKEKISFILVSLIFVLSFSVSSMDLLWHLGKMPAGFPFRYAWLFVFFILQYSYMGILSLSQMDRTKYVLSFSLISNIVLLVMLKDFPNIQTKFILINLGIIASILLLFFLSPDKYKHTVITFLLIGTSIDLLYNLKLVQDRFTYNEADVFIESVNKLIKVNKDPHIDKDFSRLGSFTARSQNDSFVGNYKGLTNFSSTLLGSTKRFYKKLGIGHYYSSIWYNGTPFTDLLLGVKYFIDYKDLNHFNRITFRPDIINTWEKIDLEDYDLYKNPHYFAPIFSVSSKFANEFDLKDKPIDNYEDLPAYLADNYFTINYPTKDNFDIQYENIDLRVSEGHRSYIKRIDQNQEGKLIISIKNKPDELGILQVPDSLTYEWARFENGYQYFIPFINTENIILDNTTANHTLEIEFTEDTEMDITDLKYFTINFDQFNQFRDEISKRSLTVNHFSDTSIRGQITTTETHPAIFISVPYDEDWEIKLDGRVIEQKPILEGMMAVQSESPGQHSFEMNYKPKTLFPSFLISISSLLFVYMLDKWDRFKKFFNRQTKKSISDSI